MEDLSHNKTNLQADLGGKSKPKAYTLIVNVIEEQDVFFCDSRFYLDGQATRAALDILTNGV